MEGLTDSLHEVSRLLVAEECLDRTLARIADLACRTIVGCEMASVTVLADGKPRTAVFTEDDATAIDGAQYLEDAGPCLATYREQAVIGVCDTQGDPRWPEFGREAIKRGVLSSLSLPLVVGGDGLGALNLYSRRPHAFTDNDEELGSLFAQQAAVALANAQVCWHIDILTLQVHDALEAREVIGQAEGMLMAHTGVTADEAFDYLHTASQRLPTKPRVVADHVVFSGEPPKRRPIATT
jgi:transcriptional regulator with GAF, ATPase, and Fis domain